jgi:uridine phosphorylase
MLHFYQIDEISNPDIENAFIAHTHWDNNKARPIVINNSKILENIFDNGKVYKGMTTTAGGFYGPQGRVLRLPLKDATLNSKLDTFSFEDVRITNLEMETSAIYGLSKLLGHEALSLNAIIANRPNGNFSKDPKQTVENLINYALECITKL